MSNMSCGCVFIKLQRDTDGTAQCLGCGRKVSKRYLAEIDRAYDLLLQDTSKEQYLREWGEEAAKEITKLKEALREAVQTLEFYARVNNWHTDGVVLHCMDVISVSDTEYCSINEKYGGRRAREFQSKHAAIIAEINPPTMGDK